MSSVIPINPCEIVHGLRQPDQGLLARVSAGPPWPMAACHKGQKTTHCCPFRRTIFVRGDELFRQIIVDLIG